MSFPNLLIFRRDVFFLNPLEDAAALGRLPAAARHPQACSHQPPPTATCRRGGAGGDSWGYRWVEGERCG